MTPEQTLFQATLNRLIARLGTQFVEIVAKASKHAKDAPDQLRKEWNLFQEEVIEEIDRLENESMQKESKTSTSEQDQVKAPPKRQIERLRAKVIDLNRKIETKKR